MSRKFDLVVLGATGYTGRLVTAYLAKADTAKGVKWAIAGRSKSKLEAVLTEAKTSVPILTADTSDAASIDALAKETTIIIACAGPFDTHGPPVMKACVENSTHYVDITGEFTYARRMIEQYHDEAKKKGIVLVPMCGFDSIPSDASNFVMQQEAKKLGKTVKAVRTFFGGGGSPSGGTLATMMSIFTFINKKDLRNDSLCTSDMPRAPRVYPRKGPSYDNSIGSWTGPFVMAGCNERVVRRSNGLYGSTSTYVEALRGPLKAAVAATLVQFAFVLFAIPFVRSFMTKYVLPAPGTGPSEASRKKGKFSVVAVADLDDGSQIQGKFKCDMDGYDFTGMSVAESALELLALTKKGSDMRTANGFTGGVLTPMTAFGQPLVDRLVAAGVNIVDVGPVQPKSRL